MNAVYRNEDKYNMPLQKMWLLEQRIRRILRPDSHGNGSYYIQSIYFDDIGNECYRNAVDGNPNRLKYRIRMYDHSTDVIKLEVKKKHYSQSTKLASTISNEEMNCLLRGRTIDDSGSLDDPRTLFNLAISRSGLRPVITIGYTRNAYTHPDGDVRVTFDRNIGFNRHVGMSDSQYMELIRPSDVMEVKYTGLISRSILSVLENNYMEKSAYSKYALCMEQREVNWKCQ